MRVVATEKCKTYYGMVCIDIAEGDEFEGGFAEFLALGGAPVTVIEDAPEPDPVPEPAADLLDISGTAKEVLAWVGDNPARAVEAREAEAARDKPRSTLLKSLDELADN